jgi:AcrR family transcriptional regulator
MATPILRSDAEGGTRQRIVQAGLRLFHDHGYTGTTVRDIAAACGLSPGAMYNHFASKDDLLYEIIDGFHDLADDSIAAALRAASERPEDQLESLVRHFTALHIAHPLHTHVANRDYIYLPRPQRDSIVRRRRRIRAVFADVLRAGEKSGVFAFEDLGGDDAITATSMALLNVSVSVGEWFDEHGPRTAEDVAALHARLALRMVRE